LGGSGTGYSFNWTNASEYYDDGQGLSYAMAECDYNGFNYFQTQIGVTVTDSNSSTVTEYQYLPCDF
jgi:hypothetical protein